MKVTVVWATPDLQDVVPVNVPAGATAADAVARSGVVARHGLDLARLVVAVFGNRTALDAPLRDGDRVELTRPLVADPKEARRRRALARPPAKALPKRNLWRLE